MSRLLDQAQRLARNGWYVLPCHSPTDAGCSCGQPDCSSPGKHPRSRRGLHDAAVDAATINRWWQRWPAANVGIRTGAESGLVVIDIDPAHGGLDTIRQVHRQHPLPQGLRVRTGSGGWHLYFAHPGGRIPNSAGTALGPGVDVRGDGGYVIAPPSTHPSGGTYRWNGRWELPHLPPDLTQRLIKPERPAQRTTSPIRAGVALSAWAKAALENEAQQVRDAAPGGRNHRLNRAAFNLGQIVGSGLLGADRVTAELHAAALGVGLGSREAERTIHSGLGAGIQVPRSPSRPSAETPGRRSNPRGDTVPDLEVDSASI